MRDVSAIQYMGDPANTQSCQRAVTRLVQHGDIVTQAVILTNGSSHGLLLSVEPCELIAVRAGFGSGYTGEGARRFSYSLELLEAHGAELRECRISSGALARLDRCALTNRDLGEIRASSGLSNWRAYGFMQHALGHDHGDLWQMEQYPLVVPYRLIDSRLTPLAVRFWHNPDDCILKSFRRLEDVVRERTGGSDHGVKLFRRAFLEADSVLCWPSIEEAEQSARGQLFTATYSALRNPRAHREIPDGPRAQVAEFLAVNHLFLLERQAVSRAEGYDRGNA